MCDPTALAIGSLVLTGAGVIGQHKAQDKAADANEKAAKDAFRQSSKDISLLQQQEQDKAGRTIFEVDRQGRATKALAAVSAGEAGVSGVSVEALFGDIDRQAGEFSSTTTRNLDMTIRQLQREKASGRTVAQGRIASVPKASPFASALQIGAAGLDFWAGQIARSSSPAQR